MNNIMKIFRTENLARYHQLTVVKRKNNNAYTYMHVN